MKIAHLSDIHIGPKHLTWVERALMAAAGGAIREKCDLAVISGDSFDAPMGVHEPAVRAYIREVVRLAGHMPVVVLQGTFSHDRPGSLDILREIPSLFPILVADTPDAYWLVTYQGNIRWESVAAQFTGDRLALVCCLPSLNRSATEVMEHGATAYVQRVMAGFSEHTSQAKGLGLPSVLVTHGTITGCLTESRHAMVSPDHEFDVDTLMSSGADAVMVGHIHKHQSWGAKSQRVAYPGSLARLVHGDHDPKGWLLWDVAPGAVSFEFVESPTRRLFEIEFDGPPNMDELRELATLAEPDDAVRIRWTIDQEHAASVDKAAILALFDTEEKPKLEATVLPIQSVRAAGIAKAMTLEEKIAHYLKTTGDADRLEILSTRLQQLHHLSIEQIVDRVTRQVVASTLKEAA